jgi:hypothetical protein
VERSPPPHASDPGKASAPLVAELSIGLVNDAVVDPWRPLNVRQQQRLVTQEVDPAGNALRTVKDRR